MLKNKSQYYLSISSVFLLLIFILPACGGGEKQHRIVFFGDSLMDAPGLSESERYPAVVGELLKEDFPNWTVMNHGVGGNTTADGLARIDGSLEEADVVFICLGGNDFLRNRSVAETKENLTRIIDRAKRRGAHPILAGIKGPTLLKLVGWAASYANVNQDPYAYESMLRDLAAAKGIPFLDNVLAPIPLAGWVDSLSNIWDPAFMIDPIHPNAVGHQLIARHVYRFLKPEIEGLKASAR